MPGLPRRLFSKENIKASKRKQQRGDFAYANRLLRMEHVSPCHAGGFKCGYFSIEQIRQLAAAPAGGESSVLDVGDGDSCGPVSSAGINGAV